MTPLKVKSNRKQKLLIFLPLILAELYLVVTLLLYQFGPYPWPTKNQQLFWILIILYHIAFILGYCFCMKTRYVERETISLNKCMIKILKFFLILNIVISIISIVRDFSLSQISLSDIWERFLYGIKDPDAAYKFKIETVNNAAYGGKLMTLFLLLFSFVPALTIPLGLIYFRKISLFFRLLFFINVGLEIIHWVGIGTNIGIFNLSITFIVILGIKLLFYLYHKEIDRKKIYIGITVCLLLILLFIFFFNKTIGSRLEGDSWLSYSIGGIYPTKECELYQFIPSVLYKPFALITMYITQGYYAMSMALELQWIPMFGIGGEMFLQNYIDEYINVSQFSYAERLAEFGWHPTINWHSLYLWVANDWSFYGVIIFMLVLGYFFAYFYRSSLNSKNSISIVIFISLCTMVLFIPANNQIFGFLTSCIKFIFVLAFYFIFCKTQKVLR